MKTVDIFARERPVVLREQLRQQYSPIEYLLAKAVTDLPLDAFFAALFTTTLKLCSGVKIPWKRLTCTFCLLTTSIASLGFALGAWLPSIVGGGQDNQQQVAMTASVPVIVLLMVVGIINPSGVDANYSKPLFVRFMKQFSPFAHCIEALCIGEYSDVKRFGRLPHSRLAFFRGSRPIRMGALALVRNGDQVLQALGLKGTAYTDSMKRLVYITIGNLFLSCIGLIRQQPRGPSPPVQQKKRRREGQDKSTSDILEKEEKRTLIKPPSPTVKPTAGGQKPIRRWVPRIRL